MNVAILGLGLIGGSIGLGVRARGEAKPQEGDGERHTRVTGFDPDPEALARALEIGAIDEAAEDVPHAVADAEVVFAAAPVGALAETVRAALRTASPDCIVTDVGSTKRRLLEELRGEPGAERFLGGHPLAGFEQGGIRHARADLFAGAAWCLSPAPQSAVRRRLVALIEGLGAHVVEIDAESHDRLMARISHLPHVLANVLVGATADFGPRELELAAAAPSFRDATRVAGASTAIWTDIYLSNARELLDAVHETISRLEVVRSYLSKGYPGLLSAWNEQARVARASLARAGEERERTGAS